MLSGSSSAGEFGAMGIMAMLFASLVSLLEQKKKKQLYSNDYFRRTNKMKTKASFLFLIKQGENTGLSVYRNVDG